MAEPGGKAASALDARQAALLARHNSVANADRALAAIVADAHQATVAARKRLDDIEAEVEALVSQQDEFALDTPAGMRAAHRLLATKLREIHTVVADAATDAAAKTAVLDELLTHYTAERTE
ncbi:DUF4226 domain-containing protein [[Mycobacterium] burgundiense]|jgi:hypothetical protein|uniref:DUF4226 domain-containing protein n=1 Tax=[Mycobacterium] burgundiense TaxID=3064286 RepID=A0ABM9L886_9MYCO|nr:DUF4226 domain-containing protein [Mycolicibacterium sp. MU0053]CAJ1494467.1 DUF4226 domain-containing protein [Mycolicibacterium sp. MU0053]